MNNEMIIKSIKNLNTNWTWDAIANDPIRKEILNGEAKSLDVVAGPDNYEFTMRFRPEDENFRIFTRNNVGMLQWRTDTTGKWLPNRFIMVIFGQGDNAKATASIVDQAEFTDDVFNMTETDAKHVAMIYPEMGEMLQYFDEALEKAMEKFKAGEFGSKA